MSVAKHYQVMRRHRIYDMLMNKKLAYAVESLKEKKNG